jgi:hypothetical protein
LQYVFELKNLCLYEFVALSKAASSLYAVEGNHSCLTFAIYQSYKLQYERLLIIVTMTEEVFTAESHDLILTDPTFPEVCLE